MTIFRCERLFAAAVLLAGACGQSARDTKLAADNGDAGVVTVMHTSDIKRLVESGDARAIQRDLPPLLARIRASNGSIGTELVSAGFAPAPALPEKYGYERADGISVRVTRRGERIEVRVMQESRR